MFERVEERGYEPALKPFLEKHPEYQKDPIIQKGILKYIREKGYDEGLDTLFEKEPTLFEEVVAQIVKRAEQQGYEDSLLVFIKKHPVYEKSLVLQKIFKERAATVGYEKDMSPLASLCPTLFQDIVNGVVSHAKSKGYTPSLREFVDRHRYENMTETDSALLQNMIAAHQEEMGKILAAQREKEASLSQKAQKTPFFARLCFWRTENCKGGALSPTKEDDKRSLLKSS